MLAVAACLAVQVGAEAAELCDPLVDPRTFVGAQDGGLVSLLPARGSDLPLAPTAMDNAGGISRGPRPASAEDSAVDSSMVEAIPTPTAFQTGLFLMSALVLGRWMRRVQSRIHTA